MITKEQYLEDMNRVFNETRPVKFSGNVYDRFGKYSKHSARKIFGSWGDAVKLAGLKPYKTRKKFIKCANCGEDTKNPKFCSSSCSCIFLNKKENGRKIGAKLNTTIYRCKICKEITEYNRKIRCNDCRFKIKTANGEFKHIKTLTKRDLLTSDTQKYRRIRDHARIMAKQNGMLKKCFICDYSLHVECCHIKPIKSFENNILISEINKPENLVGLCSNHHWEHDNIGLMLPTRVELVPQR